MKKLILLIISILFSSCLFSNDNLYNLKVKKQDLNYSTLNYNYSLNSFNKEKNQRDKIIMCSALLGSLTLIDMWYFLNLQEKYDSSIRNIDDVNYNKPNLNSGILLLNCVFVGATITIYINK